MTRLVDLAREVCGFQAQLLSAAELALSARIAGATQEAIREELWTRRSLVRAWTVRGTIHIVAAEDLPLWAAAVGSRRYWEEDEWLARESLTRREAAAIFETVVGALSDVPLTREQVAEAVVSRLGATYRSKIASMWGDLLAPVTYMGKLCFGPMRGPNVTFVRADRWIHGWRDAEPDLAWSELLRRYLRAYGPAPLDGVARWFGIEPAKALALLEGLEDAVTTELEGRPAWDLRGEIVPRKAVTSVRLLAQYDPYVLGCRPHDSIVDPAARQLIHGYRRGRWEGATGVPVLLIDGVVSGVWERVAKGKALSLVVRPAVKLSAAHRRALADEAGRLGAFFGLPAALSIA